MGRAAALRRDGRAAEAAAVLDAYSESCAARALETARRFRQEFSLQAAASVPEKYKAYVGTYAAGAGPLAGREFKVLFRNGKLAVDIRAQMVVDLNDADEKGIWSLALSRDVAFSFEAGAGGGPCGALNLHQSTPFPRVPSAGVPAGPATPADLAPLLGTYALAAAKIEMAVRFQEGGLVLDIKGQGVVGLTAPDGQGLRTFSDDPGAKVSFVRDGSGKATALKIHRTFTLPKAD